jgi:hypothetical protein
MHDFWLLVWGLKSLQNFVKIFEKVLNGFEFKRFELKEFEKKRKKEKTSPLFQPAAAHRPIFFLPRQPACRLSFSFSLCR